MLQNFKAELFKALGHPMRIRIIELLRSSGELTVSDLQARLGSDGSGVSQQLAVLRARQIVTGRKEGTSVYYRVVDPQVFAILDLARGMFETQLVSFQAMAEDDAAASSSAIDPQPLVPGT